MKDRVKELRRVKASELIPNPKNWRRHPPAQEAAMRSVLERVGFADAVIARETPDGLEIINGHMRQNIMGDDLVPVLVLDVDAVEADELLLTFDPLAMMAEVDQAQIKLLMADFADKNPDISAMLAALADDNSLGEATGVIVDTGGAVTPQWQIIVECKDEPDHAQLLEWLDGKGYVCHSLIS